MLRMGGLAVIGMTLAACSGPAAERVLAVAGALVAPAQAQSEAQSEWTALFDGSSLDAWNALGDANWQIIEDTVHADSGNGHLVSKQSFGDFELSSEFWVSDEANSGIFIRCADPAQITARNCYEVNIFDQRPDPTYRTGSIVDVAPPSSMVETGGRWNTMDIRAQGPRLTVSVNDIVTVDTEDDALSEGVITLQYGTGVVIFRNVRIRPL
jgi:hypothetical protein